MKKKSPWAPDFALRVLAETLFYDEEYGAAGNLSLIDQPTGRERFIAAFLPEESCYIIERATRWDTTAADDLGYAIATDAETHGTYGSAEEAAAVLLDLARRQALVPSLALLFDEDS